VILFYGGDINRISLLKVMEKAAFLCIPYLGSYLVEINIFPAL